MHILPALWHYLVDVFWGGLGLVVGLLTAIQVIEWFRGKTFLPVPVRTRWGVVLLCVFAAQFLAYQDKALQLESERNATTSLNRQVSTLQNDVKTKNDTIVQLQTAISIKPVAVNVNPIELKVPEIKIPPIEITPIQRRLAQSQKQSLQTYLSSEEKVRLEVWVLDTTSETHAFAQDFIDLFRGLGWETKKVSSVISELRETPLTVEVKAKDGHPKAADKLVAALKRLGFSVSAQLNPSIDLNHIRLMVASEAR